MLFSTLSSEAVLLAAGGTALLFGLLLTPIAARLARRFEWIDPGRAERWRDRPVALMGGVAIVVALLTTGLAAGALSAFSWPIWLGVALTFAVGVVDDVRRVSPVVKLLSQAVAAVLLLYGGIEFWDGGPAWVSVPLTVLWVVGITNAFNLIDGIDGLAGGIAVVVGVALSLIGASLGQWSVAVLMAAVAGASLGFLAYNRPPASVFMGDCGSLTLGYLLAAGALSVQGPSKPLVGALVPAAVLAVPIFDTTFVTITRLLRGQAVTEGGTDHVHHRLIEIGVSEGEALAVLLGASAGFGGLAVGGLWIEGPLFLSLVALGGLAAAVFGGYLATRQGHSGADRATESSEIARRVSAFMRTFLGGAAWKSVAGVLADIVVVAAAFVIAVHLRFGGSVPGVWMKLVAESLPGIVAAKVLVFYGFGLYDGVWRHAGTPEIVHLANASIVASVLTGGGLAVLSGFGADVVSVLVLDFLVATMGVGGTRFAFRALRQLVAAHREDGRRVLIYGSGFDGILLLRHLRNHPEMGRRVVGLLDDRSDRTGCRVQGVEVLGVPRALPGIVSAWDVEEVLVPEQARTEAEKKDIRSRCAEAGVDCLFFSAALERPANDDRGESRPENGTPGAPRRPVPPEERPDSRTS